MPSNLYSLTGKTLIIELYICHTIVQSLITRKTHSTLEQVAFTSQVRYFNSKLTTAVLCSGFQCHSIGQHCHREAAWNPHSMSQPDRQSIRLILWWLRYGPCVTGNHRPTITEADRSCCLPTFKKSSTAKLTPRTLELV